MMNKTLRFSLLSMLLTVCGVWSATAQTTWVKTDAASLQSNDVVVIVDQTSSTAMSNDKGTSAAPVATAVTLNGDKSQITSEVGASLQWVVTRDGNNYQFGVTGTENYLYCTNSNNGVRVGTNNNNLFTIAQGGTYNCDFLQNSATSRYIGVYNSQDWRCYTTIHDNIKNCVTTFYKLSNGGSTPTVTTYFSQDYEGDGVIADWTSANTGRYTVDLKESNGNHYLTANAVSNGNNGTEIKCTALQNIVGTDQDFTMEFDLQLTGGNNQASSFFIMDAGNSEATPFFKLIQSAAGNTTWNIQGEASDQVTITKNVWYSFLIAKKGDFTYLTLKNKSTDQTLRDQAVITTLSTTGGLGMMKFTTKRYYAYMGIDNVVVRDLKDSDYPNATPTTYTLNYIDTDGNPLKSEVLNTIAGTDVTANADQMASFMVGDKMYIYVSGNTTITTVEDAASNVITLTFREAETWAYTVNATISGNAVAQVFAGAVFEGQTANVILPNYINVNGQLAKAQMGSQKDYTFKVTPTENNAVVNATYALTGIDHVVVLSEAEDVPTLTAVTSAYLSERFSAGRGAYAQEDAVIATLQPGTYKVTAHNMGTHSPLATFTIKAGDETVWTATNTSNSFYKGDGTTGDEFTVNEPTDLVLLAAGGNGSSSKVVNAIDWFYVTGRVFNALDTEVAAAKVLVAQQGVAYGKLQQAIDAAEALNDGTLSDEAVAEAVAALLQAEQTYQQENADTEEDVTARVKTEETGWMTFDGSTAGVCATQFAPAITTYDGRTANMVEKYQGSWNGGAETTGYIIWQDITGLTNGSYKVGFYANAFFTPNRGFDSPMADGATDVAYVFANDQKEFIVSNIAESTTENNFREFNVEVTDGTIRLGLGKEKAGTNWHTVQIYRLTWFATALEIFNKRQVELAELIAQAQEQAAKAFLTNGKETLNEAIAQAQLVNADADHLFNLDEVNAAFAQLTQALTDFRIANPALANGSTYFLRHVASGKYLAGGRNWGTQAIVNEFGLDFVAKVDANTAKVSLNSEVYNGSIHFLGSNLYVDAAEYYWTMDKVGDALITIGNGTQYLDADANGIVILSDTPAQWQVVSPEDRLAAQMATLDAASKENPVDATFFIKAPEFNRSDSRNSAWSTECNGGNFTLGGPAVEASTNTGCEAWNNTFNVYQTLTDLPNGIYEFTLNGFGTNGTTVIYANDTEKPFANTDSHGYNFANAVEHIDEFAGNTTGKFFVTDGIITLGLKRANNTGGDWAVFDRARLYYYGADLEGMYQALLDEANAIKDENMNVDVKAALLAAIAAEVDYTNAASFTPAYEALKQAIADAEANIAAYAPVKAKLTEIDKVLAYTNVYTTEAYVAFKAQHEAYRTAYKEGTLTTEEAQTLVNGVLPIGTWHAANTIDDLLLSSWYVGDAKAKDYDTQLYINTWSTEGNNDGSNFKAPFFEYWVSDAQTLGANTLHADMDELEPGVYDVKARVRVRLSNGQTELQGIKMQLNDGDEVGFAGTQIADSPLYLDKEMTAQGIVGKDGKLSVKLIVEEGNTASWLAFKDVMVSLNGMETDALQQQLAVEAAKKDLQQLVDEGEELYEDCGIYTAATSGALREALDNAIDGIALDDITVRQLNQLKKALRSAMNALDLRGQSDAMFAVLEDDVYASGQQVEVVANDDESDVAMRITFGVEGGNDFYAGVADSSVDGFVAFTEGNGENGTANGGTVYYLEPQYNGVVTMGIALGKNKRLFIKEDETNKEAFNGQQLDEEFAGTIVFNVKGGSRYTVWAASSKLGFYGLNYEFGDGVEPVDEVNPGIATRIAGVSNDRLNGTVYNISGQKIDNTRNLKKGVYVVNGKKVMF